MTNKLPEVGKRYKLKPNYEKDFALFRITPKDELTLLYVDDEICELESNLMLQSKVNGSGFVWSPISARRTKNGCIIQMVKPWVERYFEPLEDNSQNTPQSAVSEEDNCSKIVIDALKQEIEKLQNLNKKLDEYLNHSPS